MEEVLFDHLPRRRFSKRLGATILGSDVRAIVTQEDLQAYIKTHHAPRMVLVGTGAVNHDDLVKLTEKALATSTEGASTGVGGEDPRSLYGRKFAFVTTT